GMDANANNVTRRDGRRVQRFKSFVDDVRIATRGGRRRSQYVEPPRRNDSCAKRKIARIDQVHLEGRHIPPATRLKESQLYMRRAHLVRSSARVNRSPR